MRRIPLRILLTLLLAGCAPRALRMEPPPRAVVFDHRLQVEAEGVPELFFDLAIPMQQLVFRAEEGRFRSEFRITLQARSRETGRVESRVFGETLFRDSYAECRSADDRFERELSIPLGPGEWEVEALIFTRKAEKPWRKSVTLDVPSPANGEFFLQGPFWVRSGGDADTAFPIRFANTWRINDDAIHFVDGLRANAHVECRYIAWDDEPRTGELLVSLESVRGDLAYYHREELTLTGRHSDLNWSIPAGDLAPGPYKLTIEFVTPEERRAVTGQLDVGLTAAAFTSGWEATLDMLRPIADPAALATLDDAPEDLRPTLWRDFWRDHDPNGDAPGNFLKETLCERISQANELFTSSMRPGYRSDRGQVYLEVGPPDLVETRFDDLTQRSLLIWKYVTLGRTYVFEGPYGMDDFNLIQVSG